MIEGELLVFPITNSSLLGYNQMQVLDVVSHNNGKVFINDILVTTGQEIGSLQNHEMYGGSDYCVTKGTLGKAITMPAAIECVVWGAVKIQS